jgi:hypothetical protein
MISNASTFCIKNLPAGFTKPFSRQNDWSNLQAVSSQEDEAAEELFNEDEIEA